MRILLLFIFKLYIKIYNKLSYRSYYYKGHDGRYFKCKFRVRDVVEIVNKKVFYFLDSYYSKRFGLKNEFLYCMDENDYPIKGTIVDVCFDKYAEICYIVRFRYNKYVVVGENNLVRKKPKFLTKQQKENIKNINKDYIIKTINV